MILYKYIGPADLEKILESNSIGFRQPGLFNDPFEITAAYPTPEPIDVIGQIRTEAKRRMLGENHAILSLTRSSTNPLMWAHYGHSHRGWAIGIDVNHEIFTSHEKNTVPVQYGNVIYTESKPTQEFLALSKQGTPFQPGGQVAFLPHHFEKLQRAFLFKPAEWAYEEEVRVVKCCNGISSEEFQEYPAGTFRLIDAGGPLYALRLPQDAIVSVQAGLRNRSLEQDGKVRERLRKLAPNLKLLKSEIDNETWSIVTSEVSQ